MKLVVVVVALLVWSSVVVHVVVLVMVVAVVAVVVAEVAIFVVVVIAVVVVGRLEPLGGKTKLMCGSRLVRLCPEPHGVPVYVSAPLPALPPTTPRNEGLLSGCSRKKRVSKIFVNGSTL